jgi:hypothetical protein
LLRAFHFRPQLPKLFLASISLCLLAQIAWTQTVDTGRISGVVEDSSGAIVPAAVVTIQNQDTGLSEKLLSDSRGFFVTPPLAAANYDVTVEAPGFTKVLEHVRLEVAQRVSLELKLTPGNVQESITVEASAAQLATETSTLSNLRTETAVQNLPMNGRNFAELMGLTAGVVPAQPQLSGAPPLTQARGETGYSVNGLRMEDNHFLLDGIGDNENHNGLGVILFPPMDAVEEFREETSVPDARFGRGGGTVNLIFKSGTEHFHGDVFDYLRNSDLDAKNYFDKAKPAFRLNQFGATLGGPISLTHDPKTFFFVDYEGQRIDQGLTFVSTVPTEAERAGNFSAAKQLIYNPLTTVKNPDGTYSRTAFAGNQIPASLQNQVGLNLINLYPAPNQPGLANNYLYQPGHTVDSDTFDIKIDRKLSDADNAFARYSQARSDLFQPGPLPAPAVGGTISGPSTQPAHQAVFNEQHIFSPTTVNSFRAGFSRIDITAQDENGGSALANQAGIPGSNVVGNPLTNGLPVIAVTGAATLGTAGNVPAIIISNNFQYDDTVSLVRGRHTIQIGIGLTKLQYNVFQTLNEHGTLNFTTAYSQNPAPSCATSSSAYCSVISSAGTGVGFADLLLGSPLSGSLATVDGMRGLRRTDLSTFIQDDFKVTNRLTVNLGLRYENYLGWPWTEVANRGYNFIPSTGTLAQLGSNGVPRSGVNGNNLDFMPRVGLAYQVRPRTVIRAAYGIFYNDPQIIFGNSVENNAPEAISYAFTNSQYNFVGARPASAGFLRTNNPLAGAIYSIDPNAGTPYSQQWNATIQDQLTKSTLLTVAYVGTKGTDLAAQQNINQPVPGTSAIASRRPYQLYQNITEFTNIDSSSYNALQITAERRLSAGLDFQVGYTWSHALDSASFNPSGGGAAFMDTYNHRLDYGNADFDIRNRLTASFTYNLPFKAHGWVGQAVNGWQTNGILSLSTGGPFSVQSAANTLNTGGTSRASYVPGVGNGSLPSDERTLTEWFNVAAFSAPPALQYGNAGRNILRGPATHELDLSLFKNFSFGADSTKRFQIRAEAFNITNTPEFNNPASTIGAAGAGSITSAGSPFTLQRLSREIQLAAKFYF